MSTTTQGDVLDPVTRRRLFRVPFLILGGLTFCAVIAHQAPPLLKWKVHHGAFSNDFSPEFDISRLEISMPAFKNAPTILVWAVPPYLGLQRSSLPATLP
jgi:hypothetical protein